MLVTALALFAAIGFAAVAAAAVYGGSVGPQTLPYPAYPDPFYVKTSDAGALTRIGLTFSVICAPDAYPVTVDTRGIVPASSLPDGSDRPLGTLFVRPAGRGRFVAALTQRGRDGERIDLEITGTLARRRAHGTVSAHIITADRARECRGQLLRWRAQRDPGRIFAGNIPDVGPLVLRRTSIRVSSPESPRGERHPGLEITAGYYARCQPSSWMRIAVRFLADVQTGRFRQSGISIGSLGSFDIAGQIGARRASGTFAYQLRRNAAVASECVIDSVPWTATTG